MSGNPVLPEILRIRAEATPDKILIETIEGPTFTTSQFHTGAL